VAPYAPDNQAAKPALQKTAQHTAPGNGAQLAEYQVTYQAGDQLFDLSFEIEKAGQYVGECGVTLAKTLNTQSQQATALEVWLFDAASNETTSKILMSKYCYEQEALRNELEKKGQALSIQPGETVSLETKGLQAQAKFQQVEYEPDSLDPQSIFKLVVLTIGISAKAG
jgi:hypothetical protein